MAQTITDTAPARVQLGASSLNRRWFLEVADPTLAAFDSENLEEAVWVPVRGIQEIKVDPGTGSTTETTDFDGEGFVNQDVTSMAWGVPTLKLRRGKKPGTGLGGGPGVAFVPAEYDDGQEIIRKVARLMPHSLPIRVSEIAARNMPRIEAYQGFTTIVWGEDGGDTKAVSTVSVALAGQGKPHEIDHPYAIEVTGTV